MATMTTYFPHPPMIHAVNLGLNSHAGLKPAWIKGTMKTTGISAVPPINERTNNFVCLYYYFWGLSVQIWQKLELQQYKPRQEIQTSRITMMLPSIFTKRQQHSWHCLKFGNWFVKQKKVGGSCNNEWNRQAVQLYRKHTLLLSKPHSSVKENMMTGFRWASEMGDVVLEWRM